MWIENVKEAYSSRDDVALAKALDALQSKLIGDFQVLGPAAAAVALQLGELRELKTILNKIAVEASEPQERLVFCAGFVSGYAGYLARMTDEDAVVEADARLAPDRDPDNEVERIRLVILKTTFVHAGARHKELVGSVMRDANVKYGKAKHHVDILARQGLIERLELGPKAVSYRISRLGEAVLARRSQPYELALFMVDQAARDGKLQAAMQREMDRTWRSYAVPTFESDRIHLVCHLSSKLNNMAAPFQQPGQRLPLVMQGAAAK